MFRNDWLFRFPFFDFSTDTESALTRMLRGSQGFGLRAFPAINVHEDPERVVVTVELPGVAADRLDLKVQDDILVVKGERPVATGSNGRLLRSERWHGAFERQIALPAKVSGNDVEASYQLGVLTVTLPKAPEARPRLIKVKTA